MTSAVANLANLWIFFPSGVWVDELERGLLKQLLGFSFAICLHESGRRRNETSNNKVGSDKSNLDSLHLLTSVSLAKRQFKTSSHRGHKQDKEKKEKA